MPDQQTRQRRNDGHSTACPGSEMLAALLDGRLGAAERSATLEAVARCEACREVLAEAARFALDNEEGAAPVELHQPRTTAAPPGLRRWAPLVAASLLAAVGLLFLLQGRPTTSVVPSQDLLASFPREGELRARLGPGWADPLWAVSRGGGSVAAAPSAAFRLGARTTDLAAAVRARGRDDAERISRELEATLQELPLAEPMALAYGQLSSRLTTGESWTGIEELSADAEALLREGLEARHFEPLGSFTLGQWIAAARLAARSGNSAFLDSARTRDLLERWQAAETSPALARSITETRRLVAGPLDDGDLEELERRFASWLSTLAERGAETGGS